MIEGWSQWSRGAVERMDTSQQKIHTLGVFQSFHGYGGKFTRTATFMTVSSLILVSQMH